MLVAYSVGGQSLLRHELRPEQGVPGEVPWVDLIHPTREEELKLEQAFGIEVPTREEMQEIEISSRLYSENGAVYVTATVMLHMDSDIPATTPVTFVLCGEKLVTVRYEQPRAFTNFAQHAQRPGSGFISGPLILLGLFEALIDRLADVFEQLGVDVDGISRSIFSEDAKKGSAFQDTLRQLGRKGDLTSKARESLLSLARVIHFLLETVDASRFIHARDMSSRLKALDKDVGSLLDHVNYTGNKISFLLTATLGLINIEQNNIFRLFSMVTVTLMPPTLIGSIYGMNFEHMPELDWALGYPSALGLMLVSAIVPLIFFRRRGWF